MSCGLEFEHDGHELAEYLRSVADYVDRPGILWHTLRRDWDAEQGTPELDNQNRLWATWKHTGGGSLIVVWKPKENDDDARTDAA